MLLAGTCRNALLDWALDQAAAATMAVCCRSILTSQKGNCDRADLFSLERPSINIDTPLSVAASLCLKRLGYHA